MKWKKIPKESTVQPETGTYKDWKNQIAQEGSYQCVYCAIHEGKLGGRRNFHIEHYKPKSKFKDLVNDIQNLFYACPICNTFKSNDWPADPLDDHSTKSYPNPAKFDYNELFEVEPTTGIVKGNYVASKYLVERVHLNRSQIVIERRRSHLREREEEIRTAIRSLLPQLEQLDGNATVKLLAQLARIEGLINNLKNKLDETPLETSGTK